MQGVPARALREPGAAPAAGGGLSRPPAAARQGRDRTEAATRHPVRGRPLNRAGALPRCEPAILLRCLSTTQNTTKPLNGHRAPTPGARRAAYKLKGGLESDLRPWRVGPSRSRRVAEDFPRAPSATWPRVVPRVPDLAPALVGGRLGSPPVGAAGVRPAGGMARASCRALSFALTRAKSASNRVLGRGGCETEPVSGEVFTESRFLFTPQLSRATKVLLPVPPSCTVPWW